MILRHEFKSLSPPPGYIERMGYRGFLSAVWMLYRMNRNARRLGISTKAEFTLGVPWLK